MGAPTSDVLSGLFGAQKGLRGWFRYQRVNLPLVKTDVLHILVGSGCLSGGGQLHHWVAGTWTNPFCTSKAKQGLWFQYKAWPKACFRKWRILWKLCCRPEAKIAHALGRTCTGQKQWRLFTRVGQVLCCQRVPAPTWVLSLSRFVEEKSLWLCWLDVGVYSSCNPAAFLKSFTDCVDEEETL